MLNEPKIKQHLRAARELDKIIKESFGFIKQNLGRVSEYDVQSFILEKFKESNLKTDRSSLIIAVNENAASPHYYPSKISKIIKKNNLIMIDVWAGLKEKNSYFADITWMGYSGKIIPDKFKKVFSIVIGARDIAVKFIKSELKNKKIPLAKDVDRVVREYFLKRDVEKFFIHSTGHSIGLSSPHGKDFKLSKRSDKKIKINIPFTIEPGLYFKNQFGMRSEIDCYINSDYKLIITTKRQNQIIKIY